MARAPVVDVSGNESDYYTYEQAREVLGFSYSHLANAASLGFLHPVRQKGSTRRYLLKSEVDAKKGQQLYSTRKTKEEKTIIATSETLLDKVIAEMYDPEIQQSFAQAMLGALTRATQKAVQKTSPLASSKN